LRGTALVGDAAKRVLALADGLRTSTFFAAPLFKVVFRTMSIVSLSPKVVLQHLYTP
jgi:hypothetical protein